MIVHPVLVCNHELHKPATGIYPYHDTYPPCHYYFVTGVTRLSVKIIHLIRAVGFPPLPSSPSWSHSLRSGNRTSKKIIYFLYKRLVCTLFQKFLYASEETTFIHLFRPSLLERILLVQKNYIEPRYLTNYRSWWSNQPKQSYLLKVHTLNRIEKICNLIHSWWFYSNGGKPTARIKWIIFTDKRVTPVTK